MDEKFDNILDQALQLFSKYGIRSVSMDDLCREMAISKKTLYQYVSSKADLIDKLLYKLRDEGMQKTRTIEKMNLNAIDALLEVSKEVTHKLKTVNTSMTFDLAKFYPDIHKKHSVVRKRLLQKRVESNLKQGIEEGFYREDLNTELVASLYVQKLEDILSPDFMTQKKFTPAKIFEVMFVSHIRGISNQRGLDYLEKQQKKLNFKID